MMQPFKIRNRFTGLVIFSFETASFKLCIEEAVKNNINLYEANLYGADLYGADLRGADLRGANLQGASLYGADLWGADLQGASLYGADLRGATISELALARLKITPEEGAFVGWKKLKGGVIAQLVIPHDALRMNAIGSRKCRASKAFVNAMFGADHAYDQHTGKLLYRVNEWVEPDSFDPDIFVECSNGIHFFLTRIEAENY